MKNNRPRGVLVLNGMWASFVEDLEALSSPSYSKDIEEARRSSKRYSLAEVKARLGL